MKTYDIERYINGELNGDELKAFEIQMNENPELQEEVKRMQGLIEDLKVGSLSNKIKNAQSKNLWDQRIRYIFIFSLFIALLFLIGYYFKDPIPDQDRYPLKTVPQIFADPGDRTNDSLNNIIANPDTQNKQSKSDQIEEATSAIPIDHGELAYNDSELKSLANKYYLVPDEFAYERGPQGESILDSAKFLFNNEQYKKGLDLLNSISNPELTIVYFKAHFYFMQKQFQKAEKLYKKSLTFNPSKSIREEIEWYILLNSLSCGIKCDQSIKINLARITNNKNHPYYPLAKNIKKSVDLK